MARKKKRGKGRISKATAAAEAHKKVMKRTKLGSGARFKDMTKQLKKKGAKNPAALAAWIGRKKYGKTKMTKLAVKGKKKKGKKKRK